MFESFINSQLPLRTMSLTGQGRVNTVPDMAVIRLGAELTGTDLAAVQTQNAMLIQGVLDALHRLGVSEIRTFQYTVDKYIEYVNDAPVERGYTVRNILEIRTKDLGQLGTIIDTAVGAGANTIDLISFETSNLETYYRQALNLAVADAIEKARSISDYLDIRVDGIPVKITETSFMPGPPQPFQRELAATPVVPGNITIEAGISAEFVY